MAGPLAVGCQVGRGAGGSAPRRDATKSGTDPLDYSWVVARDESGPGFDPSICLPRRTDSCS
jgi:hypothetical protein